MTGLFQHPIVNPSILELPQQQRGAALLVAHEARPEGSVTELLSLSRWIVDGDPADSAERLPPLFTAQNIASSGLLTIPREVTLDPVHPANPSAGATGFNYIESEQPEDDEPR